MNIKFIFFLCICLASAFSFADEKSGSAFSFYLENDTRDLGGPGSDNAYSNGFRFSYVLTSERTPEWAVPLTTWPNVFNEDFKNDYSNFGISIGQQIYTPNDTNESALIANDRPYAGWLYVGLTAQFKNKVRIHTFELDLGLIGPDSGAEKVQNEYHRIIAYHYAQGWRNQLATEPTVQIYYQQRQKFIEMSSQNQKYFDVIPFYGAGLGNVSIDAHAGGMMRAGYNLADDFGPKRASATEGDSFIQTGDHQETSVYGFIGGRGIAVARNIFLDGNTFRQSHRVKKVPFVLETEFGFGANLKTWNFAWRFVTRSPEFEERTVANSFVSISISTLL